MTDDAGGQPLEARPGLLELTDAFARIGLVSFGGPAGQIALMHRVVVDEKRWLDEPRFLHALNYCMLLPGPEAMQLATYVGWLMHGVRGGLIAGLLFVMPGALVLLGLSIVYLVAADVGFVQGLLFGLKAAVLAVVAEAIVRLSRRSLTTGWQLALAIVAFAGVAFLKLPFPAIVLGAAICGVLCQGFVSSGEKGTASDVSPVTGAGAQWWGFLRTSAAWIAIWLAPLGLLYLAVGREHVWTQMASFFSVMAAVSFGGAYALLGWVAQQAVEVHGWLRPDEMLTGLGLAETTPGPLILVLLFVGFLGGARLSDLEPLLGGTIGALVALWFTFATSFLFVFAGAPFIERLRHLRWLSAALAGVTAAVVGVIANLALWFGLQVLFDKTYEVAAGPLRIPVPEPSSINVAAALIALAAGIALIRFKVNMIAVLAASAIAGMIWVVLT